MLASLCSLPCVHAAGQRVHAGCQPIHAGYQCIHAGSARPSAGYPGQRVHAGCQPIHAGYQPPTRHADCQFWFCLNSIIFCRTLVGSFPLANNGQHSASYNVWFIRLPGTLGMQPRFLHFSLFAIPLSPFILYLFYPFLAAGNAPSIGASPQKKQCLI